MRAFLGVTVSMLVTGSAQAEPYRLRAEAFGQARTPTGVLALSADASPTDWAGAEALIWAGTNELGEEADVLVVAVTLHDLEHRGQARLGRMIASLGALRPIHLDGVSGRFRFASGTSVEVFGGFPVTPRFSERSYDWAVGARVAQSVGSWASAGVAYLHRRDAGRLSDHEVAGDLLLSPYERVDFSARASFDLIHPGFSEAIGVLSVRPGKDWRIEVQGTHRSPSRILPATSLFSVLGDVASRYLGGRVWWRAAPRLDLIVEGGARAFDEVLAEDLRLRGVLRLDPWGRSSVSIEASRRGAPDGDSWTGGRGALQLALGEAFNLGLEAELVRPDRPADRGSYWPWGLLAFGWKATESWEIAAAVEGAATAEQEASLDVLVRAAYQWSAP